MRIEESIIINRSADEVFGFFDDRRNDSRWMGAVVESEWLEPAARTGVGRRGRMVMKVFGTQEFSDAVTEYEPGRRVAHRSVSGSVAVHSACAVEPVAEGTRATLSWEAEHLPGGRLGALAMQPLLARAIRRNYRGDLARLKGLLENHGRQPVSPTPSPAVRWLGLAGLAAPVAFILSAATHSLVRADHSLWREPVSALAAGPHGWVQSLTFVVTGVLLAAFGLGLHLALRPKRHIDPGPGFLALFGVGLVGAGVFPAVDAAGVFVDDHLPHVVAGFVTFASAGVAASALAPRLRRDPQWSDLAGVMRLGGAVLVALFVVGGVLVRSAGAPLHDWLGLFQWVFLAVWFPCVLALAGRLLARPAASTGPRVDLAEAGAG